VTASWLWAWIQTTLLINLAWLATSRNRVVPIHSYSKKWMPISLDHTNIRSWKVPNSNPAIVWVLSWKICSKNFGESNQSCSSSESCSMLTADSHLSYLWNVFLHLSALNHEHVPMKWPVASCPFQDRESRIVIRILISLVMYQCLSSSLSIELYS